jgi:hypothetical protein
MIESWWTPSKLKLEVRTMKVKLCSVIVILFLSIGVTNVAQDRGQGRGPAGGPPAGVGNTSIEHGSGHGQANKPTEPNQSANSTKARNDVAAKLSADSKLASKLQGMLPAGMNVNDAANGFKNFGQFVAAVHLSKNQSIPFDQLKGAIVTNNKSLAEAAHELKPELSTEAAKNEAKKAEEQAKEDQKTIS